MSRLYGLLLAAVLAAFSLPAFSGAAAAANIASLSTTQFKDGQTGIQINGSGFCASQGAGDVRLYAQGRNQPDASISQFQDWIEASQTETAWGDTQITFTAVLPTYGGDDWPGWYRLEVTDCTSQKDTYSAYVLVGPNQTVNGTEVAGFAWIDTTDNEQTVVNAEAAGTAFLLETGVHPQFTVTRRDDDIFVGSEGTILDGGKDISSTWTDETGSWSKTGQTQNDTLPGTNRIDGDALTGGWGEPNNANQEFYIGLSSQAGPLVRMRRDASQAAIEAAGSDINTLGSNPIATTAGEHLIWVTDTATGSSGDITPGEAVKLSSAGTVGGLAIDGWWLVAMTDTVNGKWAFWHPNAATSTAAGGGASVSREKSVRCYFNETTDTVYINTDPDAANTVVWASVQEMAFPDTGAALTGVHIRGHPDSYLEIRHYATEHFDGAVQTSGGSRLQYLYIHHTHGKGLEAQAGTGDDEVWDYKGWYNGKAGFGWNADSSFMRRFDLRMNNTAHYDNQEHGAGKISVTSGLDIDQMIVALSIISNGLWIDIDNEFSSDGVRRIDAWDNAKTGIYIENNNTLTAEGNLYNSLVRDNSWYQVDSGWGARLRANNLYVKATTGTASFNMVVRDNVVVVRDGQIAEATNPTHGIVIKPHLNQEPTRYIVIQNNITVFRGNSNGVGQSGFYSFDGDAGNTQAEMDGMNSTSDWVGNTYYHPSASSADIFGYMEGPSNYLLRTLAEWQAGTGMDHALDDDGTFNMSQSAGQLAAQIPTWIKGAMPTWDNIQSIPDEGEGNFPQTTAPTETSVASFGTSNSINLTPANSGDLLIMCLSGDDNTVSTTWDAVSGWTTLYNISSSGRPFVVCYNKIATGSEGSTQTVTATGTGFAGVAAQVYRVTNWYGDLSGVEFAAPSNGTSTTMDPPSLSVSWGSRDTLWIAVAQGGDDDETVTSYPSGFVGGTDTVSGAGTNSGATVATARQENTANTVDPGSFVASETIVWRASTIAIRPAAAGETVAPKALHHFRQMQGRLDAPANDNAPPLAVAVNQ